MCGEIEEEVTTEKITLDDVLNAWGRTSISFKPTTIGRTNDQGMIEIKNESDQVIATVQPGCGGDEGNAKALVTILQYVEQEWLSR